MDALRGFALCGVFGANLFIFSGYTYMNEAQRSMLPMAGLDRVVHLFELIFVENKFMGLFAFLFGVSFWLFLDRARLRGVDGTGLFYRRLGWLFLFGALHGWLFWCFDILRFYALWGLLLPLFLLMRDRALLGSALFCAVLAPALVSGFRSLIPAPPAAGPTIDALALQAFTYGDYAEVLRLNWRYDWYLTLSVSQIAYQVAVLGRLLLGLLVARAGWLTDLGSHRSTLRLLLVRGGLVGLGANILDAAHVLDPGVGAGFLWSFAARLIREAGYLGLTLAYASALALLFSSVRFAHYLRALCPLGRMALTCYLAQTLIGLWLFYGCMPGPGWIGRVGPTGLVLIWVAGYVLQVWFASAWLWRFRFGPAEWLWRSLTYGKIQP